MGPMKKVAVGLESFFCKQDSKSFVARSKVRAPVEKVTTNGSWITNQGMNPLDQTVCRNSWSANLVIGGRRDKRKVGEHK